MRSEPDRATAIPLPLLIQKSKINNRHSSIQLFMELIDDFPKRTTRLFSLFSKVGFHRWGNRAKGWQTVGSKGDVPAFLELRVPVPFTGGPGGAALP